MSENYLVIARMPDGLPACVLSTPSHITGDTPGERFGVLDQASARGRCIVVRQSDGALLQAWNFRHDAAYRLAREWSEHVAGMRGAA